MSSNKKKTPAEELLESLLSDVGNSRKNESTGILELKLDDSRSEEDSHESLASSADEEHNLLNLDRSRHS